MWPPLKIKMWMYLDKVLKMGPNSSPQKLGKYLWTAKESLKPII